MDSGRRVRRHNDDDPTAILMDMLVGGPNAIERSEAEGQRRLVESTQLPIDGTQDEARWSAMGIKLGEPTDELFRHATLPEGWKLQATEHSMWSELLDERSNVRATVFYKAAFYDRHARINISGRYSIGRNYEAGENMSQHVVKDRDTVIFTTDAETFNGWGEHGTTDTRQHAECRAWLDENRPLHTDELRQWEGT